VVEAVNEQVLQSGQRSLSRAAGRALGWQGRQPSGAWHVAGLGGELSAHPSVPHLVTG